ncbi:pirin family protein [Aliikangiella sp. IMCC44653]
MKQFRQIEKVIKGNLASDGDGVKLTRLIGSPQLNQLDPFLLFDAFGSDNAADYIGGFPAHPHRGFETVTYMLAGKMRHQDSTGNEGVIGPGGIQWMTAGKGIIHSEMPEQEAGLLAGFQLWVNLPASHKLTAPKYQELDQSKIPVEILAEGGSIKVIAGQTQAGTQGVIENLLVSPTYWDVTLPPNGILSESLNEAHNAFMYLIEGEISTLSAIPISAAPQAHNKLLAGELGVLTKGANIAIQAQQKSRFLVIAGKPLNESVARAGPFVMNTREEINQAFSDYQNGRLTD